MLHSLFVLSIVLLSLHYVLSETYEEIVLACYKEVGFDGRPIDYSSPDISNEVKCAMACMLEKTGAFKEDGNIDKIKHAEDTKEFLKNEDTKNRFLKAIDACDVKARSNKCETAYEFTKCVNLKAAELSK